MRRTCWPSSACASRRTPTRPRPPPCSRPRCTIRSAARSPSRATVGVNVASDALANLSSGGRHRRRAGHRRRGLRRRLLDHAGAQPRLRDEIADLAARPAAQPALASSRRWSDGFELSEASNTPVMLMVRIRVLPRARAASPPATTQAAAAGREGAWPSRAAISTASCCRPMSYHPRAGEDREPLAGGGRNSSASTSSTNIFGPQRRPHRHRRAGRHVQRRHPRAAAPRACRSSTATPTIPLYVLNVTYPLVADEFLAFCARQGRRAGGRGRPARLSSSRRFARDALQGRRARSRLHGKDMLADGRANTPAR